MDQFDETRPEFKGFNAFYRDEIIQPLIIKDQERRAAVKRYKMSLAGGAVLAIPAALGAWSLSSIHLAFFGIGGCLMGSFALGRYFLKDIKAKTKGHIVSKVCSFVGLKFTSKHFTPMDLEMFRGLHLLPKSDRDSFEDQISGQAHGATFTLHEAHLEKERRGNKGPKYVTAFRGVMMRMDFPQKFLGRTIVLRDGGWLKRKKRGDMKRVGLVDPVFEKAFEAYGTDQVEARYLLTPTFMQRLVDLENLFQGKNLRAAFSGDELLIVVEAPNQFESGSMFKPLTDPARTQKILNEIGTVFDIIDGVLKPQSRSTNGNI